MANARMIFINDIDDAKKEIAKIGVHPGAMPWIVPKAVHAAIKLEDITPYAANIIKQEMLGKGGDAAVACGVADFSCEKTDALLLGTLGQFDRLIKKLKVQSRSLKDIAGDIECLLNAAGAGKSSPRTFECGRFRFDMGSRTYIMGILNVTPDSFSDGGKYNDRGLAVQRAREIAALGADMLDIGGESTRPGHTPVNADEELDRVIPVIEAVAEELDIPVSIDTTKAIVATEALKAGACVVNDIWGLQGDEGMKIAAAAAEAKAGVIMMHNKNDKHYEKDIMGEIIAFLRKSVDIAQKAGIMPNSMVVDPGIGFGKTYEQNLEVMHRLKELKSVGLPVLLGTSRKSMIGNTLGLPADDRLEGTAATIAYAIAGGADIVRVHDIREMARVAKMTDAMARRE